MRQAVRSRFQKFKLSFPIALLLSLPSLAPFPVQASTDWRNAASILATGEGDTVRAQNTLSKMPELDKILAESLQQGGRDEYLALAVIASLERESQLPTLMDRLKSDHLPKLTKLEYVTTLTRFSNSPRSKEIADLLRSRIPLTDGKSGSALRSAVFDYLVNSGEAPDLSLLNRLLDDSDYLMRMKAMEQIEDGFKPEQADLYLDTLKKALVISPYPVRIRAAKMAGRLSPEKLKTLRSEIRKCSQDEQTEVRLLCSELNAK
jgi:hypothetical protein